MTTDFPEPRSSAEPRLHIGDYAAWYKHITGEWLLDAAAGEFINRKTGKPVRFKKENEGYLRANIRIKGVAVTILKHRAVWIAAHGILALPLDYALEVDHINGDRTDCRIKNLRLVTREENLSSRPGYQKLFTPKEVRTIRKRYQEEDITQKALANEYGVSITTIRRLLSNISYRSVE